MITNYNEMADAIINDARTVLALGKGSQPSIDTAGMSEIGKHVCGQVNNFSFSPETTAKSILREGYSRFTAIVADLARRNDLALSVADAAQDKISDAADEMGMPL